MLRLGLLPRPLALAKPRLLAAGGSSDTLFRPQYGLAVITDLHPSTRFSVRTNGRPSSRRRADAVIEGCDGDRLVRGDSPYRLTVRRSFRW